MSPIDTIPRSAHNSQMNRKVYLEADVMALLLERKGERTQTELAQEIGISGKYLSDVLTGKRAVMARAILEYLGLEKVAVESTKAA